MKFSFFRSVSIALAMLSFLLFGITVESNAFEIETMKPSYGGYYDYTGYLYHCAYLKTSEPFHSVSWYINDTFVEAKNGNGEDTDEAYFYPNTSDYPGSPLGRTYTIEARAVRLNGDEHVTDSESYDVTVYSSPVTKTKFGNHTMAEMSASIDVGWNGHTAEVTASASVKTYSQFQIGYGFNLRYNVVRLTPNGNWAADLWVQPPGLAKNGGLNAEEGSFDIEYYTPDPASMDLRGGRLDPGNYRVGGQVTASANLGKNFDFLSVPDSEDLFVPDDE